MSNPTIPTQFPQYETGDQQYARQPNPAAPPQAEPNQGPGQPNAQQANSQQVPPYQAPRQPYPPQMPQTAPAPPYGFLNSGYPQQGGYYPPVPSRNWNVLCIVGFILAFVLPPVGVVLCIIALVQINKSHEQSKGLSIAGIIIGALGTVFMALIIGLLIWAFNDTNYYYDEMCYRGDCHTYSDTDAGISARGDGLAALPLIGDTQK